MRLRAGLIAIAAALYGAACVPFVQKGDSIRVLVFNIHAGKDAGGEDNIADVARLVRSTSADLVLLQEVDRGTNRSGQVDQLQALMDATGFGGAFGRSLDYDGGQYGIAALARNGFIYRETVALPVTPTQERAGGSYEPRAALVAVAVSELGRLQTLNTHLDASAADLYRLQEVEGVLRPCAPGYRPKRRCSWVGTSIRNRTARSFAAFATRGSGTPGRNVARETD
jgi:endonuclease/exonuclease/phosphatase family metal-dependent hydrolase